MKLVLRQEEELNLLLHYQQVYLPELQHQGQLPHQNYKSYSMAYFDVVLISRTPRSNIVLKEFNKYDKARQFLEIYANLLKLPSHDEVEKSRI